VTGDFCSIDAAGKRVRERTIGEMEQVCQAGESEWVDDAHGVHLQAWCGWHWVQLCWRSLLYS
jgi:hypothetical protein